MPSTAARKALREVDEGTWIKRRRDLTVERFVTSWLEAIKYDVATNTHVRYTGLMKQHVIPRVGKVQLAKLTPQHLTRIYQAARTEGLSPQTVLHVHRAMHTALNYGVKVTKDLSENVAGRLKAPRVERRVSTTITPEKVRTLIEAARGTRLEVPVLLSALTGMRRGELLALKWSTVSLDRGSLYVAEALEHTRSHGVAFKAPKSRTSRRVLPLAPECVALLRAHKDAQDALKAKAGEAYLDMDLVFPNPDGAPWPPDSFSVQFGKLARTAECQGFRLHDLRHAFATLTLADGASIREVSDLLGHSSRVADTLNVRPCDAGRRPGGREQSGTELARRGGSNAPVTKSVTKSLQPVLLD